MKMELTVKTSAEAARSLSVTKASRSRVGRIGKSGKPPRKPSLSQSRGGTTIIHASDPSQFRDLVQEHTSCKPSPPPPAPLPSSSQKPPSRIQKMAPAPIPITKPTATHITTLIQPVARDGRTSPLSSPGLAAILNAAPKDSNFPISPLSRFQSSSPFLSGFSPHQFSPNQQREQEQPQPITPPWGCFSPGPGSLDFPGGAMDLKDQQAIAEMVARGGFFPGGMLTPSNSNGVPFFPWSPAGMGGPDMCLGFGFSMGQLSVPSSPFRLGGGGREALCEGPMAVATPKDYGS